LDAFMLVTQRFEEIRVYAGFAERTGVFFERDDVRHSDRCCTSVSALIRKARASGDGTFYLKVNVWPAGTERVELRKQWIVMAGPFDGGPAGG
jgi:hypothetical protein